MHLQAAIDAATRSVATGGGPFGAVILTPDGRTFTGANQVTQTCDPTAHAEVVAIREACRVLGRFELSGCVLYASCEPCPMCLAACQWARLERVEYAATAEDAAEAGFDDRLIQQGLRGEVALATPVTRVELPDAEQRLAPFRAWAAHATRTDY
ncbi:nucleoside deaminase [Propionibacteriaceae bacterium Y1923]